MDLSNLLDKLTALGAVISELRDSRMGGQFFSDNKRSNFVLTE